MSEANELETLLSSVLVLLSFDDAAATSLGAPFDVETLASTSRRGTALDEAQLDLGEGPSWQAFRTHRPVPANLRDEKAGAAWPFCASALVAADVCSVLALPLSFGPLHIGAVTLFSSTHGDASAEGVRLAQGIVVLLGRAVVARALAEAQAGTLERDASLSRREVHQATGMVISQTKTPPADALLMLRAHAFSNARTVKEVAADILSRRLDFSIEHNPDH